MATVIDEPLPQLGCYDVVIIGAGFVGSMIARQLSRFKGRFALVEKNAFPCFGVSKASLAQIHLPDFCPPGSLKGRLGRDAPARFKILARELDVAYREMDELWLALEPAHLTSLAAAKQRGEANGATGFEIIGPQKVLELEPHVTQDVVGGLFGKGVGVIHPPEWGFALVENAVQNGVAVHLNTAVTDIVAQDDGSFRVVTSKGIVDTRFVINAAGLYADEIAWMVGDHRIRLTLRKGTMLIFDKSASHLVRHMIFGTFSEDHSQDLAPTSHGNLILGVHYVKPDHKQDTKVSRTGIRETLKLGQQLVPALSQRDIITSFAGILATNNMAAEGDFYISASEHTPGVLHIIVGAPGLTAAPAIADLVIDLLADAGLQIEEKRTFQKRRMGWHRFQGASLDEKQTLIAENQKFGHIVCRCEQVTEAEIEAAIQRGADSIDAVKHLTRAGMGRCQGGFCGISVLKHLARQLDIAPGEVSKMGNGSSHVLKSSRAVNKIQGR